MALLEVKARLALRRTGPVLKPAVSSKKNRLQDLIRLGYRK